MKTLFLIRSCPGAGKSTLAGRLSIEFSASIFSTDQFFHEDMDLSKPYVFDFSKLGFYHLKNLDRATKAMDEGLNVIIDNTNTVPRDADGYIKAAYEKGYQVKVMEPDTPWKFDANILFQKNQHNVPLDRIEAMIKRWVPHDQFIKHFKDKYPGLDIS